VGSFFQGARSLEGGGEGTERGVGTEKGEVIMLGAPGAQNRKPSVSIEQDDSGRLRTAQDGSGRPRTAMVENFNNRPS
jgi:hypothetical protein